MALIGQTEDLLNKLCEELRLPKHTRSIRIDLLCGCEPLVVVEFYPDKPGWEGAITKRFQLVEIQGGDDDGWYEGEYHCDHCNKDTIRIRNTNAIHRAIIESAMNAAGFASGWAASIDHHLKASRINNGSA